MHCKNTFNIMQIENFALEYKPAGETIKRHEKRSEFFGFEILKNKHVMKIDCLVVLCFVFLSRIFYLHLSLHSVNSYQTYPWCVGLLSKERDLYRATPGMT